MAGKVTQLDMGPGMTPLSDSQGNEIIPTGSIPGAVKFDYQDGGEFAIRDQQYPDMSWAERFKLKNFSANPASMKGWLGTLGYQVKDIPGHEGEFNFAIRKSANEAWYVVDPSGFDSSDITDLVADAVITGGSVSGGLMSGPAAILAGGAIAGGGELAREGIGSMMGAPDNIDPMSVGMNTVTGAAFPAAGQGLVKAGTKFGSTALMKMGAMLGGIRGTAGLPASEVLSGRMANWSRTLRTPLQAAQEIVDTVRTTGRSRIPAWLRARAIENTVTDTVDATPIRNMIQEYANTGSTMLHGESYSIGGEKLQISGLLKDAIEKSMGKEASEEAVQMAVRDASQLVASAPNSVAAMNMLGGLMDNYLELAHGVTDWSAMPVSVASELKSVLQTYARTGHAYSGQGNAVATGMGIFAKRLARGMGDSIDGVMSSHPLYKQWGAERDGVEVGIDALTNLRQRLFTSGGREGSAKPLDKAMALQAELYGNEPWNVKNMIAMFKESFGVNLETPLVREAGITNALAQGGETSTGALTANYRRIFGAPLGTAAMGGIAGYAMSGGSLNASLAGAMLAPQVFSPRGMVWAGRALQTTFKPVVKTAAATGQAAYLQAIRRRDRSVMNR